MLSVVLWMALLAPSESGLKLDAFEDYVRGLVGEEWKLQMDQSIAIRPVVWYLGKQGDGVADLIRSCELLDLECLADREKKMVTIRGPFDDPLHSMREQYRVGIIRPYERLKATVGKSDDAILAQVKLMEKASQSSDLRPEEKFEIEEQLELCNDLLTPEGKLLSEFILARSIDDWADVCAKNWRWSETIDTPEFLNTAGENIKAHGATPSITDSYLSSLQSEKHRQLMRDRRVKDSVEFRKAIQEGGVFRITTNFGAPGWMDVRLSLVGDSYHREIGVVRLKTMPQGNVPSQPLSPLDARAIFDRFIANDKHFLFERNTPINALSQIAVESGENCVNWLGRSFSEIPGNWEQAFQSIQINHTSDGWYQLYYPDERFPTYYGDSRGYLSLLECVIDGKLDRQKFVKILLGFQPGEVDSLIRSAYLLGNPWETFNLEFFMIPFVYAGLTELASHPGTAKIEMPISELSEKSRKCIDLVLDSMFMNLYHPQLACEKWKKKRGQFNFFVEVEGEMLRAGIRIREGENGEDLLIPVFVNFGELGL
jgi:hypothetical protein